MTMQPTIEDIRGAVARGWCHPDNAHKVMDVTLALAIADEVAKLYASTQAQPATADELAAFEAWRRAEGSEEADSV